MVAPSNKYSLGDEYEDAVNRMLNCAWKRVFTKLNRTSVNGENSPQFIRLPENESYALPDITVMYNDDENIIEMRVEVKGFHTLPRKESPDRSLPLFPIKIRQLQDYWNLFQSEEVMCRIVVVVGDRNFSEEFTYYWSTILDLSSAEKKKAKWDGEMAFWFNIEDMSSDFSTF